MKRLLTLVLLTIVLGVNAQQATRFFYELNYKPKKDAEGTEKVMTVLDITGEKSIYKDYTLAAQDSAIVAAVEEMERTKTWKDPMKMLTMPKFTYKITKQYPITQTRYTDNISRNLFAYDEPVKFEWKVENDRQKIGEYNAQKATTEFRGRNWTAWFTPDIPFPDGPYKFYGLPGLIVKIEDSEQNYSWELKGNRKIEKYSEQTEADKINARYGLDQTPKIITKEKFEQAENAFRADPLAEFRQFMTPEMMGRKMPGSDKTVAEFMKEREKMAKDFFNYNTNPIELTQSEPKKQRK